MGRMGHLLLASMCYCTVNGAGCGILNGIAKVHYPGYALSMIEPTRLRVEPHSLVRTLLAFMGVRGMERAQSVYICVNIFVEVGRGPRVETHAHVDHSLPRRSLSDETLVGAAPMTALNTSLRAAVSIAVRSMF